jgi:hypothetical protein
LRLTIAILVAVALGLAGCGLGGDSAPTPAKPALKTFTNTAYHFSVSYDPKLFAVATTTDKSMSPPGIEFYAEPRLSGPPATYGVVGYGDGVSISVSTSPTPAFESLPRYMTEAEARRFVERWEAAHHVSVRGMDGTLSVSSDADGKSIAWRLHRGGVYFYIQLDCRAYNWPVWGPRMLAVVHSLKAGA